MCILKFIMEYNYIVNVVHDLSLWCRYEEWDKYSREIEELNVSVENFTVSTFIIFTWKWTIIFLSCVSVSQSTITTVEKNINEMLQTQHLSRSREARDLNLLLDNNSYVQTWSIAQIIVIMVTTTIQVYFVRKLFEVRPSRYSRARI